jgi:hypothetical protein
MSSQRPISTCEYAVNTGLYTYHLSCSNPYRVTAHDVVAITLRAVVYYLAKNPAMQEKLQEEISDAADAGNLSNPAKYSEITPLSYV